MCRSLSLRMWRRSEVVCLLAYRSRFAGEGMLHETQTQQRAEKARRRCPPLACMETISPPRTRDRARRTARWRVGRTVSHAPKLAAFAAVAIDRLRAVNRWDGNRLQHHARRRP